VKAPRAGVSPPTPAPVNTDCVVFKDKIPVGVYLVFDDYDHMNTLDPYIRQNHFKVFEKGIQRIKEC
jgi:hypothetical protein